MAKIALVEIQNGRKCRIMALGRDDRFPFFEFLDLCDRHHEKELSQLQALLDRFADQGQIRNKQKVRHLGDGLWEFKAGGILRVTWFWERGHVVVCGHCFVRKSEKTPGRDLKQAKRWKALYEDNR